MGLFGNECGYTYAQPMVAAYPPVYVNGGNGNGGGLFGGDGDSWLGILFLIALLGGGLWGNNGGFGNGGGTSMIQDGFNQAALTSQLSGLQTSVTTGFSNQEVANCGRAMDQMQAYYTAQIANMQENFANTRATDARLDAIVAQNKECCCELKTAMASGFQGLQDKLCQLEMDGYKTQLAAERSTNADLRMATALATVRENQLAQTRELEQFMRPPINPTYTVPNPYGYTNGCCNRGCNNVFGITG